MILTGTIQQTPAPGATTTAGMPLDQVTAEADTYDDARARVDTLVPDGWRLLSISRW